MFTENIEKEFVLDCFSLFNSLEMSDIKLKSTKDFLNTKFTILFDEIGKSIYDHSQKDSSIIDIIFDAVNTYAYGYSLDNFCESTYLEYTHGNSLLNSRHPLLEKCNEQIKYHCFISSLYTILAIYNKDNYRNYFDVAKGYSSKEYKTLDDIVYYSGYEKKPEIENKIRSAYDTLCKEYKVVKDTTRKESEYLLSTDEYLRKAFNYKSNSRRMINMFLDEFSFDMIVNQMSGGFHILSKVEAMRINRWKNANNFRRETKRFIERLKIIDRNFRAIKSSKIDSLLYYWKRESLFHINALKYLINTNENEMCLKYGSNLLAFPTLISLNPFTSLFEEILHMENTKNDLAFIIRYLSEITFPVYTYTFFIALCECFNYSIEDIKNELTLYIDSLSIKMELHDDLCLKTDTILHENAYKLGEAIVDTFNNNIRLPYFDNSFYVNINYIGSEGIPLFLRQSSIGLAYYYNILQ